MSSEPKPGRKRRQKLEPIDWRELAADPVLKGNMSTLFRRPAGERSDEVFSDGALLEIAKRNSALAGITSPEVSSPEISSAEDSSSEPASPEAVVVSSIGSELGPNFASSAEIPSPEESSPEFSSPEDSLPEVPNQPAELGPQPIPTIQTSSDVPAPEIYSPELSSPGDSSAEVDPRPAQKRRVFFAGDRMQSALSPLENDCYLWMWSHAAPVDTDRRRISFKMAVLAQALNISERAATDLVRRMENKYCLEPDDSWFPGKQSGKGFYLYSMRRILARRRAQGLEWAIKGGRGIELISEAEARRIQALRVAETPMPVYGSEQPDDEITPSPEATSPED